MNGRCAAAMLLLCSCTAPRPAADHVAPLNGGATEDGHPATVMLFWTDGASGVVCSGSVIAPRVVVSAKHCFTTVGSEGWTVNTGPRGELASHVVTDVLLPEGPELENEDIAVVITGTVIDAAPYEVRRDFGGIRPADEVQLTGYGQNPDDGQSGRKYTGQAIILGFGPIPEGGIGDAELIVEGAAACGGDSGGTLEDSNGALMGIIVRGADVDCGDATQTVATRIDHFLDLVDQGLAIAGGCTPTGPELCNGVDDDCDGVADDPACADAGGPCVTSATCRRGECVVPPGFEGGVCTMACDVAQPVVTCPPGTFCRDFNCGTALCVLGVPSTGTLGDPCDDDLGCAGAFCRDPGDGGGQRCLSPCQEDIACGAGSHCTPVANACGGCAPLGDDPDLLAFGQPCEADAECASGLCGADDDGSFCTQGCGDCPAGYHCAQGACARGEVADDQGTPCDDDDDCLTGLCAHWPEGGSCTRFCREQDGCPAGLECTSVDDERSACKPTLGIVGQPCALNEECLSGLCGHFDDLSDACTRGCSDAAPCPLDLECIEVSGLRLCAPPAGDDSTYGCGCRPPSGGHPSVLAALLSLLALALFARRRQAR